MTNATIRTLYHLFTDEAVTPEQKQAAIDEIIKEGQKLDAEKEAKEAAYAGVREAVFSVLTTSPKTMSEIWEACKNQVPEGTTKGQVQYGITRLWASDIVKIDGKPNTYRLPV